MAVIIDGTAGIANNATDLSDTGTLTGGTGVVNLGSGQVYKDASGNVGIGTSSPSYKLSIGAAGNSFSFGSTTSSTAYNAGLINNSGGSIYFGVDNSAGTAFNGAAYAGVIGTSNATPFQIFTNNVTRATIDASGNLLVGTTVAPFGSAAGVGLLKDATGGRLQVGVNAVTSYNVAQFYNPNGLIGSINVAGAVTAYVTSSDYRLKEAIAPMTGALAKVALLKPCTYKWKVDGSDGQGFIAHELAEVEAGCVTGEKDAVDADGNPQYQGIDTSFLVATLAAAIQELKAIVDAQATRITALEGAAA